MPTTAKATIRRTCLRIFIFCKSIEAQEAFVLFNRKETPFFIFSSDFARESGFYGSELTPNRESLTSVSVAFLPLLLRYLPGLLYGLGLHIRQVGRLAIEAETFANFCQGNLLAPLLDPHPFDIREKGKVSTLFVSWSTMRVANRLFWESFFPEINDFPRKKVNPSNP